MRSFYNSSIPLGCTTERAPSFVAQTVPLLGKKRNQYPFEPRPGAVDDRAVRGALRLHRRGLAAPATAEPRAAMIPTRQNNRGGSDCQLVSSEWQSDPTSPGKQGPSFNQGMRMKGGNLTLFCAEKHLGGDRVSVRRWKAQKTFGTRLGSLGWAPVPRRPVPDFACAGPSATMRDRNRKADDLAPKARWRPPRSFLAQRNHPVPTWWRDVVVSDDVPGQDVLAAVAR